ncbi:restriction endonuclease subunit S [Sulfurimonas autotrophica]|uniref:Restriction modification system DNA specificity domain protein n=1 Tax=Sulfurimonas autotrophica (strain ATCC BAA-671 / DSM 16294 / JCM 11897 / OK10) TaxID=563040 RepID=E0UQX3_SULAO|nr:restriction endonuclease subunit S [Sulfurimonas autotrophica]ADN08854.1 restriction modification system DNA specificity domain protein [Sulfurimonas autotrophica DSM 16294]
MNELYELPDGWEWKKLEEITELITKGTTPTTNGYKFLNEGINFLKIENIVSGEIDLSTIEMFISKEAHQAQRRSQLKENDVLFSIAGTIGDTAIVKKEHLPMNINQAIALIRPKESLNSKFLKYSLLSIVSQNTKDKQRGGAIKNISLGDMKNTNYPLPPLQEQKRIVGKLDSLFEKIDRVVALHQKNMDEADAFMGSVLNDVFGKFSNKKIVALKGITSKIGSGATPRGGQKSYKTEGISFIRSMNIYDTGFREKGLAFIDDEQAQKLNNVTIEENDVLINITGASVARCCIVDKKYLPARVNQHVSILRLKDRIIPSFLHYYLISPFIKSELLFNSSGGATREAITKTMLEEFQVPLISLSLQQKTVTYLDKISLYLKRIKEVQKEKMENLKALKASILDEAFRGKL